MAKKESVKSKAESTLSIDSALWAKQFRVGDAVKKMAKFSTDYGMLGVIKLQEVSPGGYHFAWVAWGKSNLLKPEHYNCIKRI